LNLLHQYIGNRLGAILKPIFYRLLTYYGPQGWWPADGPFEIIVGAILTQNTTWGNVEKAVANLKMAGGMSPKFLREISQEDLAILIRPSGYFNSKARKLKSFATHLARYSDDLDMLFASEVAQLRKELLGIYGIGDETADDIILYAANKPSFVIDSYTRRIILRLGLTPEQDNYAAHQRLFADYLPPDTVMFNEYHALLDRHAKETCRKTTPLCRSCCLLDICPDGQVRCQRDENKIIGRSMRDRHGPTQSTR
jgi:endonuclease-3 related protein